MKLGSRTKYTYSLTKVRLYKMSGMSEPTQKICRWLHEQLERLSLTKYPFSPSQLPRNGIYFFYERGETWGHDGNKPRIIRIGTHKSNNFRSRIKEHFLLDNKGMNFDPMKPAPKDRSVFRKNIGRALLRKRNSNYLRMWNIDFTPRRNRERYGHLRDIEHEKEIERDITRILRNRFTFRFIIVENETRRIGSRGLESRLIGTVSRCPLCKPTNNWLGDFSPKVKIRKSGLWQIQHLNSRAITEDEKGIIKDAIAKTRERTS